MNNKVFITIIALIVGVGLVVGVLTRDDSKKQATEKIEGIEEVSKELSRSHVEGPVDYEETKGERITPPQGGPHSAVWLDCNRAIYEEPVKNEQAVHGLEHGAVWITYNNELPEKDIKALEDNLSIYTFMSPYPEQTSPIVLTAWGVQLEVDSADDPRIDSFLDKYRQGPQTPEPGASCDAPQQSM